MMPPDPVQVASTGTVIMGALGVFFGQFCLTVWNNRSTGKKVETKGEDVKTNTPSPDDMNEVRDGLKDLSTRVACLEVVTKKAGDMSLLQSQKYTESLNVLSAELSAQKAAFQKYTSLKPVPEVLSPGSVTALDVQPQPNGKVIRKP